MKGAPRKSRGQDRSLTQCFLPLISKVSQEHSEQLLSFFQSRERKASGFFSFSPALLRFSVQSFFFVSLEPTLLPPSVFSPVTVFFFSEMIEQSVGLYKQAPRVDEQTRTGRRWWAVAASWTAGEGWARKRKEAQGRCRESEWEMQKRQKNDKQHNSNKTKKERAGMVQVERCERTLQPRGEARGKEKKRREKRQRERKSRSWGAPGDVEKM